MAAMTAEAEIVITVDTSAAERQLRHCMQKLGALDDLSDWDAARCWGHQRALVAACYAWTAATGNVIPLCTECCAIWRADVEAGDCDAPARIAGLARNCPDNERDLGQ